MELPHDRGHSWDRGCTERLPAAVLDNEVEECIGFGETTFRDKRAVEQIHSASREMNLCGSSRGGGAASEVEPNHYLLARVNFRGAMVVDLG